MAHENTVSFKVFLEGLDANKNPEVRRFGIDRDVVSNYAYLCEKLQTVFPGLRGKQFDVAWKDLDDDSILISSDDELMIALTEMQGDVRKLFVTIKGDAVKNDNPKRTGSLHPGVVCDICESTVHGFRYKCLECRNYDLCADCEAKSLHPEHFMIRLPVPVVWRQHMGKGLVRQLSKFSRGCGAGCGAEDGPSGGEGEGQCPFAQGHRHRGHSGHHGGHHGSHHGVRAASYWIDLVGTYLNDLLNEPENPAGAGESPASAAANSTEEKKTQTAPDSTTRKEEDAEAQPTSTTSTQNAREDYLMNVGKAVASFLDPLGIDVDVKVERNKTSKAKKAESKAPKKEPSADKEAEREGKGEEATPRADTRDESPIAEGWTVVNGEDTQAQGVAENGEAAANQEAPESTGGEETPQEPSSTTTAAEEANAAATHAMCAAAAASAAQMAHTAARTVAAHMAATTAANSHPIPPNLVHSTGAYPKAYPPVFYPPPPPPTFGNVLPPPLNPWGFTPPQPVFTEGSPFPVAPGFIQPRMPPQQQQQQQQQQHQQEQSQQAQQQSSRPKDEKIAAALDAMIGMGFSNEGGWLAQLLEMKNGDIDKVLDVLQYGKKN